MVGGVVLMWAAGYNWSVASVIGLIALAGVAAEIGVVMLVYLDQAYQKRRREGRLRGRLELFEAVREGAGQRLRPVVMTATAVIGGLLPILWGHGTGASVMKRIAAPMVGGMVSATLLTMLVIPVVYSAWREWGMKRGPAHTEPAEASGDEGPATATGA
jgi:Cu(I)/Ag(I) efflux system membrane protein CusA/SilA